MQKQQFRLLDEITLGTSYTAQTANLRTPSDYDLVTLYCAYDPATLGRAVTIKAEIQPMATNYAGTADALVSQWFPLMSEATVAGAGTLALWEHTFTSTVSGVNYFAIQLPNGSDGFRVSAKEDLASNGVLSVLGEFARIG